MRKRTLAEWGVSLKSYKEEFENGIYNGFHPQFGCPRIDFKTIKDGLDAISHSYDGVEDPMLQIVNQHELENFKNLLAVNNIG